MLLLSFQRKILLEDESLLVIYLRLLNLKEKSILSNLYYLAYIENGEKEKLQY